MSKQARWAWALSGVAMIGVATVLLFVLALTGPSRGLYERHVVWLFWTNVAVAAALTVVIVLAAVRLAVRVRRRRFGSRLLLKLAGIFALVGVVPGVLIYTVSVQFVSRSIETWFDARVQGALDAGLELGKGTLDTLVADAARRTREAAERLSDPDTLPSPRTLERLREQWGASEVAVLGAQGQVLVSASASGSLSLADRPSAASLRKARQARVTSQLEGLDDDSPNAQPVVRALAAVPVISTELDTSARYLLTTQAVPPMVVRNALSVQAAYGEYQQRALAQDGLRKMYIGTLTLSLILAVFGAVALAALLGQQLARPLIVLADGMRQVAGGDLSAKPMLTARDELSGLTRSFAEMTEQLGQARQQAERSVNQLQSARARLQTILDSLSAGVIVFDAQRRIDSVNPGATRILRQPLSAHAGQGLEAVPGLAPFAGGVWQRFELHDTAPEDGERDHWQETFEIPMGDGQDTLTVVARGAQLPQGSRLLVFDDITEIISAQRTAAWSEVARRLAHEIKNPLTPIQLSAERLLHKLEPQLDDTGRALLTRSVGTIVSQVQAMLQLVNEFRDYARLPAAKPVPLDLNGLVTDVLGLYGQAIEQGRLVARCEAGLPWIVGDATQLRQVVHNLVQNGLDAVERQPQGRVELITQARHHPDGTVRSVRLTVQDNGPGFSDKVMKRAFEPYVTTKPKGTGLGLAVVRKIVDEHGGRIRLGNRNGPPDAAIGGSGESPAEGGLTGAAPGAQVSISFLKLAMSASAAAAAA